MRTSFWDRVWLANWFAAGVIFWGSIVGGNAAADDAPQKPVTYSKEVSRIFQTKCLECHRAGQLAPMSLETYKDVRPWAKSIKKNVLERTMPPWHADPHYGKFRNDISLSDTDIQTVSRWVDEGATEGNPAELPEPKKFADAEWKSGTPDVVLTFPASYKMPASVEDEYRCVVVPTNFQEDAWVTAFEYKIGNRKIVHHVIAFLDTSGELYKKDMETPEPGFDCSVGSNIGSEVAQGGLDRMLGGWAPGTPPNVFSEGIGKLLPKNSYYVFQMHYHNETGLDQSDQSAVGIWFAKKPVQSRARIMPVSQWRLDIKAGDKNAEAKAQWRLPRDIVFYSVMPHMHYLGKDMTVSTVSPEGQEETIISVPRFDFNWQTVYGLAEPKRLPKGTLIKMVAHHDNSADNPHNPTKPPKDVHWGEATTDEMAMGWIGYIYADEHLNIPPKPVASILGSTAPKEKIEAKAGN